MCTREDGQPWPPDVLSTSFAALIRNSDMTHFRLHDLRHTHATQLLKQGVHPKIVSERPGHSNIGIPLDTYSHVLPGMQEGAIADIDASMRTLLDNTGN
jgi:integrase